MDLSRYRLNETKELMELKEKYGDRFDLFFKKVFQCLDNLKEGEVFDVLTNVCPENQELFIKIGCFYVITESRKTFDSWVEASNDYRHFKRFPSCHPIDFKRKRTPPQLKTM